jgi:ABC-type multidrug transport system ATPase subunit
VNATPVIELRNLRKEYGSFVAVHDVSLTVCSGDVYGFLGPNGAGKSTTIRMMLSLITPTSGSITLFGKPLATHRRQVLRRIGAIVERPDFYNFLSAEKNLYLLGKLSGADISKRHIRATLAKVGLEQRATSKVKTFSHGMKQRLGIAQALLHNPDVVVLDEPTTGLDPNGMVDVRDLILHLAHNEKKTVLLSSHILPEVELTANKMVIINKGQVVQEGLVDTLLNAGKLKVTFEVSNPQMAQELLAATHFATSVHSVANAAILLMLSHHHIADVVALFVQNGIHVSGVVPVRSLEEYFLSITEGAS